MSMSETPFHSGFIALLGRPNVGKSTLVNRLVGSKVSIVSDHPQTTRRRISGVVGGPGFQLVLLDLPGFQKPFDSLTSRMQATVDSALSEVDAALVMFNAAEDLGGGDRFIAEATVASRVAFVCVLNKVDAVSPVMCSRRLAAAEQLVGEGRVTPMSAKRGDGVGDTVAALMALMPEGPRYFPEGATSDQPLELLVAELVREQALRVARDELPHAIAVHVDEIRERPGDGLVEIDALLYVESESQKPILIGKGGRTIKQIGSAARHEIETVLGARVFLSLRVKVRRHWRRDDAAVERFL
jgi:GTP-binding protein Era